MGDHGGESRRGEGLAPVIPLFGGATRFDAATSSEPATRSAEPDGRATPGSHSIPSAGGDEDERADRWHRSWLVEHEEAPVDGVDEEADRTELRASAETALLRKLRSRSMSVREARGVLAGHDLEEHEIDAIVDAFLGHGYLDDARLAEQLVHIATDRKAQGRQAVAQTLTARGVPREVVDAALAELPDDDAERALTFARQKARSMGSLDRDTALRRLHGQLARRGFGGATAMSAARQALDEAGTRPSSVRFH